MMLAKHYGVSTFAIRYVKHGWKHIRALPLATKGEG